MIENQWFALQRRFENIELDAYIVMPNHFHGIIILNDHRRDESRIHPDNVSPFNSKGEYKIRPVSSNHPNGTAKDSIGRIIQAFKSITTNKYINGVKHDNWKPFPGKLWQRNYFEHVIRDKNALNRIRTYIINNPDKWQNDKDNSVKGK